LVFYKIRTWNAVWRRITRWSFHNRGHTEGYLVLNCFSEILLWFVVWLSYYFYMLQKFRQKLKKFQTVWIKPFQRANFLEHQNTVRYFSL
jgi:hypothetical protein